MQGTKIFSHYHQQPLSHYESAKPARSRKKRLSKLLHSLRFQGDMIDWWDPRCINGSGYCNNIYHLQSGVKPQDSPHYYFLFFTCNTISFSASVSVIFLLISRFPLKNKVFIGNLTFVMGITQIFLVAAYVLGSPARINPGITIGLGVLYLMVGTTLLIYTIRLLIWLVSTSCLRKFIPTWKCANKLDKHTGGRYGVIIYWLLSKLRMSFYFLPSLLSFLFRSFLLLVWLKIETNIILYLVAYCKDYL